VEGQDKPGPDAAASLGQIVGMRKRDRAPSFTPGPPLPQKNRQR
jgi:hypothetical protein